MRKRGTGMREREKKGLGGLLSTSPGRQPSAHAGLT